MSSTNGYNLEFVVTMYKHNHVQAQCSNLLDKLGKDIRPTPWYRSRNEDGGEIK